MDTHRMRLERRQGERQWCAARSKGGLSKAAAARQFNTTPKTVAKSVARFRSEGIDRLRDRSSKPHSLSSHLFDGPIDCEAVRAAEARLFFLPKCSLDLNSTSKLSPNSKAKYEKPSREPLTPSATQSAKS